MVTVAAILDFISELWILAIFDLQLSHSDTTYHVSSQLHFGLDFKKAAMVAILEFGLEQF